MRSLPCFVMFQVYRPKSIPKFAKGFKGSKGRLFTCTSQSKGEKESKESSQSQVKESKLSQKSSTHHQGISRLIPGTEECSKAQKDALGNQISKPLKIHTENALRNTCTEAGITWANASRVKSTCLALNRLSRQVSRSHFGGYLVMKFTCSPSLRKRVLNLRSDNLGQLSLNTPCSHTFCTS